MSEPIRVLQGIVANDKGGLTGYICQNYRYIDKNKIQFDFITYDNALDFQEEFEGMGAKFYRLPRASHIIDYYFAMRKIQKKMHYEIVHYNMSYANIIPLVIAKLVGIKIIIIHSHSTQIDSKNIFVRKLKECFHSVFKNIIPLVANDFLACSTEAAKWMFPKSIVNKRQYCICHNAINTEKFAFNENKRKSKRSELMIKDNTLVIGHVGRFSYQKNHEFLLKVFYELQTYQHNSLLMLVGSGENEDAIKKLAESMNLGNVLFLGQRDDVPELMQAMDVFLLPSRFEGLSLVGIEAQCCGLPCIFSDVITREIGITPLAKFISLDMACNWKQEIINISKREHERKDLENEISNAGYCIECEIKNMEVLYKKAWKQNVKCTLHD